MKVASTDKAVTVMVDLTREATGCLRARLLDAAQSRSGKVYADWLDDQGVEGVDVKVTIEHAALDPFRGYANAIRDELPDAVAVLDAFHVVKLAGNALDDVRRRVQQETLHRRGHKDDPLYKIRRTLLTGEEHLTDQQRARLEKYLPGGDPDYEVEVAWRVYQLVRSIYHATSPTGGRTIAEKVLDTLHTCPIPEIKRLGKTLRRWREEILAYFTTGGVSNGGTEAINGVIEKTRRLAHGFRNFTNYRIRILLAADGSRPYPTPPTDQTRTMLNWEGPHFRGVEDPGSPLISRASLARRTGGSSHCGMSTEAHRADGAVRPARPVAGDLRSLLVLDLTPAD